MRFFNTKTRFWAVKPAQAAIFFIASIAAGASAQTQDTRMWRCPGNHFTNDAAESKQAGCTVVTGGNLTIVQGVAPKPVATASGAPRAREAASGQVAARSPGSETDQRARDSDALAILQSELRKTEDKLADLKREFNGGEPEKRGEEFRNNQKYLDRVAELRLGVSRTESDVAGLKREIQRAGGSIGAAGPAVAPVAPR